MPEGTSVLAPGLGLYLGQSPLATPRGALIDGLNFRVKHRKLEGRNLGWTRFSANWTLNGPVVLIDNFFPRGATEHLILGSTTDIYRYDEGTDTVVFLTPREETGTAAASSTTVTGTGTTWVTDGIKPGDEITFGTAGVTDPGATWFVVATVDSETQLTLTASAGTVVDGPYTIRRLFQGQVSDLWSVDVFVDDSATGDDLWLATNGVDDVISWNGSADQVTLHPELGFTCGVITVYSNMAIYGDIVQAGVSKPSSIINSAVGSPLEAGSTGTGLSDQFKVHGGTDAIVNILPLGDNIIIYSGGHVTQAQFVGAPFVFIFRNAIEGIGALGHHAIADFGDFHVFTAADAQYEFDGVTIKETNNHVWREVLRIADPARKFRIYGHFDEENGDLIWSVPLNNDEANGDPEGAPEFAYSEHYLEDVPSGAPGSPYSYRQFPFLITGFYERDVGLTWAAMTQAWEDTNFSWNDQFFALDFPQNIAGDENGIIWILNEDQQGAGVDLLSFVKFGRVPTGSGRERNLLTRVYPWVERLPGNMDVRVYLYDHAAEPSSLTEGFTFDMSLPEGEHFVSPYRVGRFFELRFGTAGAAWVLHGYDIDIRPGGMR